MKYSAPLDGIRAIAILAVLIFHISPAALRGGFTGVDVFFVLSGFLITSIITHDIREGRFSLAEFYRRRIQRLMPNVIVTVATVVALWTWLLPPSTAHQTGTHGLWTLFSLSNVFIWKYLGGYWGNAAELAPLTHTWSLGIEEQFYLLFPAALLVLFRFQRGRVRVWLFSGALISLAACVLFTRRAPDTAFYLLPTRVWELLLGATLGARAVPVKAPPVVGWAGVALIGVGFVFINESQVFPGAIALIPAVGTLLVLCSITDEQSRLSRWLAHPFMVAVGALSYSLYLWHWPLITLGKLEATRHDISPLVGAAVGGAAGILLSIVAYAIVERPLRNRGTGRGRRFAIIATGFAATSLFALTIASRPLIADPQHRFEKPEFDGLQFNAGRAPTVDLTQVGQYYDVTFPPLPPRPAAPWRTGGIIHRYGGERPQVVVLGSSHALMYSRVIDDICRDLGVSVAFLGADQRSLFFESADPALAGTDAREFDEARKQWLRTWRPSVVLAIDRWDVRGGSPADFDQRLHAFLADVAPVASHVLFVAQVPVIPGSNDFNLRELAAWRLARGMGLPRFMPNAYEDRRHHAVDAAERERSAFPNLEILRADLPFYQPDGAIRYIEGRQFLYADDNHLAEAGAETLRAMFHAALAKGLSAGQP